MLLYPTKTHGREIFMIILIGFDLNRGSWRGWGDGVRTLAIHKFWQQGAHPLGSEYHSETSQHQDAFLSFYRQVFFFDACFQAWLPPFLTSASSNKGSNINLVSDFTFDDSRAHSLTFSCVRPRVSSIGAHTPQRFVSLRRCTYKLTPSICELVIPGGVLFL